jgi:hypothetical protein
MQGELMSRLYYPPTAAAKLARGGGGGFDPGDAAKKIGKIIPTELVTAYGALVSASMAIQIQAARLPIFWICFAICWVLTPVYMYVAADAGKPMRNHIIVSTLAFPIWAYLVSGHQVIPQWYDAGIATVLTLLFSLLSAVVPMNK